MITFTAAIQRPPGVGTWHYVDIPFDTVQHFGSRGQIRVQGTLNGIPFRSTLLPTGTTGPQHYLVVGKELRDQAGVAVGDTVTIAVASDDAPRSVTLHPALAAALAANGDAQARFERLAYSHQKRWNDHITEAKREETRARRIEQMLQELLAQ